MSDESNGTVATGDGSAHRSNTEGECYSTGNYDHHDNVV